MITTTDGRQLVMNVMIGIDPHKASHTAVAVDDDERVLDQIRVRATSQQLEELRRWAGRFESRTWAVESADGLGYLIARQLAGAGETVLDVPATLASRVRLLGSGRSNKNDPNDAVAVAVCALRSDLTRVVTSRSSDHKAMRLLVKRHRDLAQLRATHCSRLHALVAELEPGGITGTITVAKANRLLNGLKPETDVERHTVMIAQEVIDDIVELDRRLVASKARVATAVAASGTCLCDIVGVGPIVAGTITGYTPDIARFPTRGSFAAYNGTAPIEVSSGGRTRHRLNRRGNRQLNFAIHIAAVVQVRTGGEGRAYYDRKIAEGKTNKEAIRALKRRISDRVWTCLRTDAAQTPGC